MRNLLRYIIRYHFFILFILFEVLSVSLVITYNPYQSAKYYNFFQNLSGYINKELNIISDYFNLKESNRQLALENARLRAELSAYKRSTSIPPLDTYEINQYQYIPTKVVNNSYNKTYNYITLNKGEKHGIHPDMGVISSNGLVGVVNHVSDNFSTAISILNPQLKISAKIKTSNNIGSLVWDGEDVNHVTLNDIPYHVSIKEGDTIVTSGYSAIFPENITIGYISDHELKGGNFYEIRVRLANNMRNISYVYVIRNTLKQERKTLEKKN